MYANLFGKLIDSNCALLRYPAMLKTFLKVLYKHKNSQIVKCSIGFELLKNLLFVHDIFNFMIVIVCIDIQLNF